MRETDEGCDELAEWTASWLPPAITLLHLMVVAGNTDLLAAAAVSLTVATNFFVWWRISYSAGDSNARSRVFFSTVASIRTLKARCQP